LKHRLILLSAILSPIALLFASLALYLSTLAPGMLRGDSGEFQWAMASLNVAHATGYPLFTLLGYAWLQLPFAGVAAWRLNLISAIFGAAAVSMVFILSRAITRRFDAALIASFFFGLAPVIWFNASILEVYSLNAFFLALVIYLLLRWSSKPASEGPLYLAFLVLGFALAHHRMTALAVPAIIVFLLLAQHRFLFNWRRLIILILLTVPGLSLYLYVPFRLVAAGATLHYAIFDIILGQEFSSSLFRDFHFSQVLWQIPAQNFNVGLVLAALGAIALFRHKRDLAIMLVLIYLADVAFALAYWVPDVEVFLTPSFVIIAVWIAVGTEWIIDRLRLHLRPRLAPAAYFPVALILIFVLLVGLLQLPNIVDQVSQEAGTSEGRARAIISSTLPAGSLLELDWETATAIRFLQTTEGLRRDLEARLIKVDDKDEYKWVLKNVDSGRPVFIEHGVNWSRAEAGYVVEPGPVDLVQIVRGRVEAQRVSQKIDERIQLVGIQVDARSLVLYWQVEKPLVRDLATYVHYYDADGHPIGQEDHASCCEAVYGYRTTEWEVGKEIADTFRPAPAGTTFLQVGMYALDNGDIDQYGSTIALQTGSVEMNQIAQPLGIGLGESIIARGYELTNDGETLHLELYWEARSGVTHDYKVFVHTLDSSGKILQQVDREPLDGVYPTSAWQAGQVVRETFLLPSTNGQVAIEFGLYDAGKGKRLARADGGGDSISIGLK
jgi:hypothetical protein